MKDISGTAHSAPMNGKKILVTGADGFIGRQALKPLKEIGFEVHAINFYRSEGLDQYATWHRCDLFDQSAVASRLREVQPSHLLHFAWYAEHGKYWTSEKNFKWVDTSMHMLRAFRENGGNRAVFAGSCAEYDWSAGHCNERTTPREPRTVYGICKEALFRLASAYSQTTGTSFAWGRIFFAYGPYEDPKRLIPSIITALLNGAPAHCESGSHTRDFMHTADIGRAFAVLADSDYQGPVNIASGTPFKLAEIITIIAEQLDKKQFASINNAVSTPENPALLTGDTTILNKILNFTPQFDLQNGIADAIAWWRTNMRSRLS